MNPSANTFFVAVARQSAAVLASVLLAVSASAVQPTAASPDRAAFLASAPLYFEANNGQVEGGARFIARGRDCNVQIEATEAILFMGQRASGSATLSPRSVFEKPAIETRTVRMILQGANPESNMSGVEQLPGKANYLIGSDSAEWRTGVPLFARVQVQEVYPGVDVIYYADQSARLEYDFVLQPNAGPDQISFRIEGADTVRVDAGGDLVLKIGSEEIRQHQPVIYQTVNGSRKTVAGGYRLTGKNTVGFHVGAFDRNVPLVIDPVLDFSTYLGGSKAENGWAIALDDDNNIYVAGETISKTLATPGGFQTNYQGGLGPFGDAFVAKYDAVSNRLVYLTYLGGKTCDAALGLAAKDGNAYVTGFTDSGNFPLVPTNNPISLTTKANSGRNNNAFRIFPVNVFVTKLSADGSSLEFSTLLGGNRRESGMGIAVDDTGVYVAGMTESINYPVEPANAFTNYQAGFGGKGDAFVSKLGLFGTNLIYSTFIGGTNLDYAESIAIHNGEAYITGTTLSTNFPMANAITLTNGFFTNAITLDHLNMQTKRSVRTDAFVTHLSADGTSLIYSTYLGGNNDDAGLHIAVDTSGNAYVTGYTYSKVFPTNVITSPAVPAGTIVFPTNVTVLPTNYTTFPVNVAISPTPRSFAVHVFAAKLYPSGALWYSTQFGGSQTDEGTGVAVDETGNAYLTGFTSSTDLFVTNLLVFTSRTNFTRTNNPAFANVRGPLTNSAGKTFKRTSRNDAFITVLSPDGASLTNSVLFGGAGDDQARGIALRTEGTNVAVYIVGQTTSPNFPINNAPQPLLGNTIKGKSSDAFVGKFLFPAPSAGD